MHKKEITLNIKRRNLIIKMNQQEFFKFCSQPETNVTLLSSGHNPFFSLDPAHDFAYWMHQRRQQNGLGNGTRVFFDPGGTTMGQLNYALKYVSYAEQVG